MVIKSETLEKSIAYMMNGKRCPYLEAKPELIEPVGYALCTYFKACEEARDTLLSTVDDIFNNPEKYLHKQSLP